MTGLDFIDRTTHCPVSWSGGASRWLYCQQLHASTPPPWSSLHMAALAALPQPVAASLPARSSERWWR